MKPVKAIVLILGLCQLAAAVSAIELEDYMARVMDHHPFFQKEELALQVESSRRETLLPRSEWVYSLDPRYTVADQPVASEFLQNLSQTAALEAGLDRRFVDGRTVGFSLVTAYTWLQEPVTIPVPLEQNTFLHGFEASFSWPLIMDVERLARLGYDLQEYTIKAKEAEVLENRESFMVEPVTLFIDWAYALELVAIYRQRLELAEEQLATTNRMFRSNLVDRLDVLRAEDAIRTAQQAIFEYQSQAKSIQAVLATLSGSEQILSESPEFEFYSFTDLPAVEEAATRGKASSRLKKPLLYAIEQLEMQSDAFEEQEKPSLDLYVQAGISGPQAEFLDSLKIIHPEVTVGLNYSPPTGVEQLDAERKLVRSEIARLEKEIEVLEKTVETNVRSLLIQAAELEKIIQLNRELIESAEEKAVEEARLYGQGRNMLTNVIQSRDAVQSQRARLVESFARYHRLLVQYRAVMDELLE